MVKTSFKASVVMVAASLTLAATAQAAPVAKTPAGQIGQPAQQPYGATGDNSVFLAGGQLGGHNASYGYVGVVTPIGNSSLGNGWVARVFAEEVGYRYTSNGVKHEATGFGVTGTVGYQHSYDDKGSWIGLYAGPAFRHVNLSPSDPFSDADGSNVTGMVQIEGEQYLTTDAKLNYATAYEAFHNNGYWARLRALYRINGKMFFGPEGVYQGDNDYKAWQAGLALVGIPITEKSSVGVNAGVRKTDGEKLSGYGGLELGVDF